jgi:tetratricopeptide (TPR) repeat protein
MNTSHFSRLALAGILLVATNAFAVSDTTDLLKKGDVYDVKLQPRKALDCYLVAEKQTPDDVRLLCRIARQYRHMIPDTSSKEEKLRLGEQALNYARRAVAVAPDDAEANLSVAISCGKMLPFESSKEQIKGSRQLKESVDKAIRLDPRNDLAWHVLGRWHQVLADVSGVKRALGSFLFG